jgi:hypothetical protein
MHPRLSRNRYVLRQRPSRCRVREDSEEPRGLHQKQEKLKEDIEERLRSLDRPQLYLRGRRVDTLAKLNFRLICSPTQLILSFRLASKIFRRRVADAAYDSFGGLALKTEWLGQSEIVEIRSSPDGTSSGSLKTSRREFQKLLESAIRKNFLGATIWHSVIHSDLEHSLSGKYVRLRFRSGRSEWCALAVSLGEDQATVDGILSSALLWRELLQEEHGRRVSRLLLIAPPERLLVLKSRLAWIRGAGRQIQLMSLEPEQLALSFIDLSDCGNLDTALTQVQPVNRLDRSSSRVPYDRASERLLEALILQDIRIVDARLDPRFVYPQVPAFLSGDRGMIDLLSVTTQGRLAVLELKVGEDIDLPLQGLDYWLRVRWHHLRQEFQRKGYFPGVELSSKPPLLFFVCSQFRYHSSFPQVVRQIDPSVPMIQVGINENWRKCVRVVLKRRLSSESEVSF